MSTWNHSTLTLNGTRLHFRRSGGTGPPLLLVHGFSDSGACWTRLGRALEAEYDLIVPDARGHGLSAPVEGRPTSLMELAQDLLALADELGLERPLGLGHSMGAVTLALAAASRPGSFRAIVLEDPPWPEGPPPDPQVAQAEGHAWYQWLLDLRQMSDEAALELTRNDHPGWAAIDEEAYIASRRQFDMSLMPVLNWDINLSWRQTVADIDCPILLITGEPARQALVTLEVAELVGQLAADAQVAHFPGASHHIHQDRFEGYVAAVRTFWGQLGQSAD